MSVLTVNNCREAISSVVFNTLPDVEYRPASSVYQNASDSSKCLKIVQGDTKSWQDYNVFFGHGRKVKYACVLRVDEGDPHFRHPLVDVRIVNDFSDEVDLLVWELMYGFVGVIDSTVNAITEAKFLSQTHGDIAEGIRITTCSNTLH